MANIYAGRQVVTLALGTGKKAKSLLAAEPLKEVTDALQALPADISTKYQRRALKKAAEPGLQALRRNVASLGEVTGNLLVTAASTPTTSWACRWAWS